MEHTHSSVLLESLGHALMIAVFVFAMMVLVDYLNVLSRGKMNKAIGGGRLRQYSLTSFLGSTPGCLGAFTNVSFYAHGLITFGAITAGMIATSGDESFVMLALFPKEAMILFGILFALGIAGGWFADYMIQWLKIKTNARCCEEIVIHKEENISLFDKKAMYHLSAHRLFMLILLMASGILLAMDKIGPGEWNWVKVTFMAIIVIAFLIFMTVPEHYLKEHIWSHIVKKHLLKVFLWSLFAILVVHVGLDLLDLEAFIKGNMLWILFLSALLGIIPESGPHLIFVMMFSQGLIPFSVLLTSSIVQDGHGMLPLLSYSIKDSLLVKCFNLIIGLAVGGIVYAIGF
ncbi:arsenic efflux protein [Candidatus Peregrinibacteria bacterium]|nr:arsenic efflux protein [Candidatus Peregrinibacteria bacterium]